MKGDRVARKSKCKICQKELDADKYSPTGKAPYYCSEDEYISVVKGREILLKLIQDIFYFQEGFIPPLVLKKIKELTKSYSYGIITECFKGQRVLIEDILRKKEFNNTAHKVNYIFAIIGNNIDDVVLCDDKPQNLEDNVDIDLLNNPRYCSKKKDITRWI